MFTGEKILITGGTGSLGTALTEKLLSTDVDTIRIFSRDESKQVQMKSKFNDERLRFLIGDVRDKERLSRALENIDIVIHTAALKHVPIVEYNPFEAVKTNVYGTQNLIEACLERGVKIALAIGTDKAVAPFNTYGTTKLLMERLFVSANYYKGTNDIKFLCVRYGNVLGSRGSVLPTFIQQINSGGPLTITDPDMTRFNITMKQAIDLIFRTINNGVGGEIFIPKLKAYRVGDVKDAVIELLESDVQVKEISVRPGEKFHESLISEDEIRKAFETEEDYILYEEESEVQMSNISKIKKALLKERYSSDKVELLTKDDLKRIIVNEGILNSN